MFVECEVINQYSGGFTHSTPHMHALLYNNTIPTQKSPIVVIFPIFVISGIGLLNLHHYSFHSILVIYFG